MTEHQKSESSSSQQFRCTNEMFVGRVVQPSGETEIRAVGSKPLTVRRTTLVTADLKLVHSYVRGPNVRRGSLPSARSFGLTRPGAVPNNWCGHKEDGHSICRFSGEFEAFSAGDFEGTTVTFSPRVIRSVIGDTVGITELASPLLHTPKSDVRIMAGRSMAALRSLGQDGIDLTAITRETRRLCELLISSIVAPREDEQRQTRSRRRHFAVTVDFIEANLSEQLTLSRLCLASGVGPRTLEYAFKEHAGMGPMAYLKVRKLRRVYADLAQRENSEPVADIANRWGFWHMGQFARDFRKQFGVLPREVGRA